MIRLIRRGFSSVKDRIRKERAERLSKLQQSLPTKTHQDLEKIRNIAIIAHIDAGKTSTTERMIFYSGALSQPGEVDDGTTTMDYLPQERARGITIRSAAISFNWNNHQINLIDTPGHVDFSGEVARSLRVLDGVVTIFDAVHGVQTQTEKVWMQANQKKLPKLAFINKMDRLGASVQHTVKTIKDRLNAESFVLQEPIGESENFKGVVDLLKMEAITFEGFRGETAEVRSLTESDGIYAASLKSRELLIQKLAEYDDELADLYLSGQTILAGRLEKSVKKTINSPVHLAKTCAVLMGAAVKNRGVQPLMDAIINYLPSPTQGASIVCSQNSKSIRKPLKNEPLCAYIFKIIYDKERGPLSYARVYSGTLNRTTNLRNTTKQFIEKIQFLYRVRADKYVLVQEVYAGDIVAVAGLKGSTAGDTLINTNDERFVLEELKLPDAIFMAPFEVQSVSSQSSLEKQLKIIAKEDNSLKVQQNVETGQLVVCGLGQLHLQIVRDRLIEAGIPTKMGKLRIGYRETFSKKAKKRIRFTKTVNKQDMWFDLQFQIIPVKSQTDHYVSTNEVVISFKRNPNFDVYWTEYMKRKSIAHKKKNMDEGADTDVEMGRVKQPEIADKTFGKYVKNPTRVAPIDEEGETPEIHHISTLSFELLEALVESIKLTLQCGKYRYPLISLQIHITDGTYEPLKYSKPIISQAASKLLLEMVHENSVLIEPIVEVELIGEEELLEHAVKDIIKKRGRVQDRGNNRLRAMVPAEGIRGWVKTLRAMGFDTDIKFSDYEQVQGISPAALVANED